MSTYEALRAEAHKEARATDALPWMFGQCMVRAELEERIIDGIKALAHAWFLEFSDETALPPQLVTLMDDVIDIWQLADLSEFEPEDEDEDEEVGVS